MRKFLLVLLILSLTGCFQYTSTIKLESDGSGDLLVELGVPADEGNSITIEDIEDDLEECEGLYDISISVDTVDTTIIVRLAGSFDSPAVLVDLVEVDEILGFDPDSFHFTQEANTDGEMFYWYKNYAASNDLDVDIEDASFDPDYFIWEERMVVPGTVIRHNADFQIADTLIWKRRTLDVINEGLIVEVVWKVSR